MADPACNDAFLRPIDVIRARQRLALAKVFQRHGEPDYDVVRDICIRQTRQLSPAQAMKLYAYWVSPPVRAQPVREQAGRRLRSICDQHNWKTCWHHYA